MTPKEFAFLVAGGLATLGVLAWCATRALITALGLAPIFAPLTQP